MDPTVLWILGGLGVVFGPSGALYVTIKTTLNGAVAKIEETNKEVKLIKQMVYDEQVECKNERHAMDLRIALIEKEVAR